MPVPALRRILLGIAVILAGTAGSAAGKSDVPVVAAAANLQFAVTEIADSFAANTGMQIRLSFGSTGNLSRQIREGAPFEMFLAADDATPRTLHADGLTRGEGAAFALGRIALVAPKGSPVDVTQGLEGVKTLLDARRITRFALANPEHAPFGVAAREALEAVGLWNDMQPVMVLGENVSQAAQFALSGNAEAGIIAYSLALAPEVAARGTFALIPDELHAPLLQRMVLLAGAGKTAEEFYAYMAAPPARAILERYGFSVPEGQ